MRSDCVEALSYSTQRVGENQQRRVSRFLTIDVEMRPALCWVWDLRTDGYITPDKIHTPKSLLCFAWKWLDEKETHFASEWTEGRDGMARILHQLLDEAEIVCGYNSSRFDVPVMLGEILLAGLDSPSPFQQVDLLKTARRFGFMSNRLGEVAKLLGTARKIDNSGFKLWLDVMEGSSEARAEMELYNRGDVTATEELYLRLRPWVKTHPNVALIDGGKCPACGGTDLRPRGSYFTRTGEYKRWHCSCGKWLRGKERVGDTTDFREVV